MIVTDLDLYTYATYIGLGFLALVTLVILLFKVKKWKVIIKTYSISIGVYLSLAKIIFIKCTLNPFVVIKKDLIPYYYHSIYGGEYLSPQGHVIDISNSNTIINESGKHLEIEEVLYVNKVKERVEKVSKNSLYKFENGQGYSGNIIEIKKDSVIHIKPLLRDIYYFEYPPLKTDLGINSAVLYWLHECKSKDIKSGVEEEIEVY